MCRLRRVLEELGFRQWNSLFLSMVAAKAASLGCNSYITVQWSRSGWLAGGWLPSLPGRALLALKHDLSPPSPLLPFALLAHTSPISLLFLPCFLLLLFFPSFFLPSSSSLLTLRPSLLPTPPPIYLFTCSCALAHIAHTSLPFVKITIGSSFS